MRKINLLGLFTLSVFLLSGCLYTQTIAPGVTDSETHYQFTTKDFRILKRVSVTGEVKLWFGAVALGGKGYQALLEEAQSLGGDAIMDYSFDVENTSVFFFIYHSFKWKATGIAIKFEEHVSKEKRLLSF
ncbi:hypothetical protein WDW89_07840 [Deltaproteobacteria bacterium TL4]